MKQLLTGLTFLTLTTLFSAESVAQDSHHPISQFERLDKELIGMRLKKAVKTLELDTSFVVISEPPGKYRGVRSIEIEGWEVQLIVNKTLVNRRARPKGVYASIKNKRIIGVSWISPDNCDSVGEVVWQHAYNRFGPCDQ